MYGSLHPQAGRRSRETLPPGNHNPGDGQAVSMVNTCEPVMKIVMSNEPKWLTGSDQKARGSEGGLSDAAPWTEHSPVDSGQALYLLTLERIAEVRADPNSYGFRAHRSTADALGQCFCVFGQKHSAEAVFDADIKSCFDRTSDTCSASDHIPP